MNPKMLDSIPISLHLNAHYPILTTIFPYAITVSSSQLEFNIIQIPHLSHLAHLFHLLADGIGSHFRDLMEYLRIHRQPVEFLELWVEYQLWSDLN